MFVYGDVVYAQTWQVLTLKTVSSHFHMPVRPLLLHRMALVSFRLFCKNLGNLQEFFGQMVYRPPLAENCPYAYECLQRMAIFSHILLIWVHIHAGLFC